MAYVTPLCTTVTLHRSLASIFIQDLCRETLRFEGRVRHSGRCLKILLNKHSNFSSAIAICPLPLCQKTTTPLKFCGTQVQIRPPIIHVFNSLSFSKSDSQTIYNICKSWTAANMKIIIPKEVVETAAIQPKFDRHSANTKHGTKQITRVS